MIDSNYSIKLADFGLAQKFSQSMNMMNSFVGTLVYSRFFSLISIIILRIFSFVVLKSFKISLIRKKPIYGH